MDSTGLRGTGLGSRHLDEQGREERDSGVAPNLTASERRTLQLFATGLPRGEIARLLKRAPKTISNTLTAARDKLGARSLAEAAALIAVEVVSHTLGAT